MPRYFLEVSYKGTRYAGFQAQPNAVTIQSEITLAFKTLFSSQDTFEQIDLVCSSRTDAGVHAWQNYFHFDWHNDFDENYVYNLNAILPDDIVIRSISRVADDAHARFDAISRSYNYRIYKHKDPFLKETAYLYPYPLDLEKLNNAAGILKSVTDFTSFSKRNTQVKTFNCQIYESRWLENNGLLIYEVTANRFLRGMVRAMTATMLKVGRGKISIEEYENAIHSKDCTKVWFDAPAHGLFLKKVQYPPV